MIEYVLRFIDRDETRLADDGGHEVGDAIMVGGHDWIVESISVIEGSASSERITLRLAAPLDRDAPTRNDQSLLEALNDRAREANYEGFTVVMPVGEWIDAQLWPASARAAEAEE